MKTILIFLLILQPLLGKETKAKEIARKIKVGDIIFIETPYNDGQIPKQLSQLFIAPKNGKISIDNGIGIIRAIDRSQAELRNHILSFYPKRTQSLLTHSLFVTLVDNIPQLKKQKQVRFIGNVTHNKYLPHTEKLTLRNGIKQCGGATTFAALDRIQIVRNEKIITVNIKHSNKIISLQSGDLVYLPQQRIWAK